MTKTNSPTSWLSDKSPCNCTGAEQTYELKMLLEVRPPPQGPPMSRPGEVCARESNTSETFLTPPGRLTGESGGVDAPLPLQKYLCFMCFLSPDAFIGTKGSSWSSGPTSRAAKIRDSFDIFLQRRRNKSRHENVPGGDPRNIMHEHQATTATTTKQVGTHTHTHTHTFEHGP